MWVCGALGGRHHLLRFQAVVATSRSLRCISTEKVALDRTFLCSELSRLMEEDLECHVGSGPLLITSSSSRRPGAVRSTSWAACNRFSNHIPRHKNEVLWHDVFRRSGNGCVLTGQSTLSCVILQPHRCDRQVLRLLCYAKAALRRPRPAMSNPRPALWRPYIISHASYEMHTPDRSLKRF
jgi:hypothetical protein